MPRSRKDITETESMLERLTRLLQDHSATRELEPGHGFWTRPRLDAESLRRISMTLHRWYELECGDSNQWQSWVITRGYKRKRVGEKGYTFEHDESGAPYMEVHSHQVKSEPSYNAIPDRERGAEKRLAKIMARYPGLQAYLQTDPRGCALYILKPGNVPEGADVSAYYSRGLAVYR